MEELKQHTATLWAGPNYALIAERTMPVSLAVVEVAGIVPGMTVLDIGASTGNTAIPAARAGAHVVAYSLTPDLVGVAQSRASQAGVEIEWVNATGEGLPFPDGSFDRVLGANPALLALAPDHHQVAGEIARVCAPDGGVILADWTPEGMAGHITRLLSPYLPPPPTGADPPGLWGNEKHLQQLLDPYGFELTFERRNLRIVDPSVERYITFMENTFGPLIVAKRIATPLERWQQLRAGLYQLLDDHNIAGDGSLAFDQEYLLATGLQHSVSSQR
jgi:2-polyprenyl-6-hydroxyphenyl methylase/3-demethylubiquinone-9 3-methyltransferase